MNDRHPSPRASINLGRLTILWLDLWTMRYGLDFELTVGHRVYALAFGFGRGIRAERGFA